MPKIFLSFTSLFLLICVAFSANSASIKDLSEEAFSLQKQAASLARQEYNIRQRILSDLKTAEKTTLAAARLSRLPTGALAALDDVQTNEQRSKLINMLEQQIGKRIEQDRTHLAELLTTMQAQKEQAKKLKKALGSRAQKISSLKTLDEIFDQTGSIYSAPTGNNIYIPQGIKIIHHFGTANDAGTVNQGITFKTSTSAPIPAIMAGKVIYSGKFKTFENLVILDHGNHTFTLYGYLSKNDMPDVGKTLKAGEAVAYAKAEREPTVYIEARRKNRTINPLKIAP